MNDTAHLMETAQRVLAAVSNKCSADPDDVEELVKFAGPLPDGIGLDEFCLQCHSAGNPGAR
jgi:hypothetical protein